MRRLVYRAGLSILFVLWASALAIWIRSRFRADVLGLCMGSVYVELVQDNGIARVLVIRDWPRPTGRFWSSGPTGFEPRRSPIGPNFDGGYPLDQDPGPLTGPELFFHSTKTGWAMIVIDQLQPGFHTDRGDVHVIMDDGGPDMHRHRREGSTDTLVEGVESPMFPYRFVSLPLWAVAGTLTMVTGQFGIAWTVAAFCRRRRRFRGQCTHCGYDRHHSPDRCPECGTC